jgi:hypothetical protein
MIKCEYVYDTHMCTYLGKYAHEYIHTYIHTHTHILNNSIPQQSFCREQDKHDPHLDHQKQHSFPWRLFLLHSTTTHKYEKRYVVSMIIRL